MADIPSDATVLFHFMDRSRDPFKGRANVWISATSDFDQFPTGEHVLRNLQASPPLANGVWLLAVKATHVPKGTANPGRIIAVYGLQKPAAGTFQMLGFKGDAIQGVLPESIPLTNADFEPVGPLAIRPYADVADLWTAHIGMGLWRPRITHHPNDPIAYATAFQDTPALGPVLPAIDGVPFLTRRLMPCPHDLALDFITREWSPAAAFVRLYDVAIANSNARLTELEPLLNWVQAVGTSRPNNEDSAVLGPRTAALSLDAATIAERVQVFHQYM